MVLIPLAREAIRQVGKYVYQTLRAQDRIIDYTYRKTGLYNRGVVRGIKHGLGGGAIVGGTLQLGLTTPKQPDSDGIPFQKKQRYKTNPPYKARRRFPIRTCDCNRRHYSTNKFGRRSRSR